MFEEVTCWGESLVNVTPALHGHWLETWSWEKARTVIFVGLTFISFYTDTKTLTNWKTKLSRINHSFKNDNYYISYI